MPQVEHLKVGNAPFPFFYAILEMICFTKLRYVRHDYPMHTIIVAGEDFHPFIALMALTSIAVYSRKGKDGLLWASSMTALPL